jgi:hypothetical protein
MTYETLPGFESVVLEESYVLDVVARPGEVEVPLDLVVLPGHASFSGPADGDRFCYRRATIRFVSVSELSWKQQGRKPAVDSSGELDWGSIDFFGQIEGEWRLDGDWGEIRVKAGSVQLRMIETESP